MASLFRTTKATRKGYDFLHEVTQDVRQKLFSANGSFSVQWLRNRRFILTARVSDTMTWELLMRRTLVRVFYDVAVYNYVWSGGLIAGWCAGASLRHLMFNPWVQIKRGERNKLQADRVKQSQYAPYFYNTLSRRIAAPYRASLIDNEPDWIDYHPLRTRPNRRQGNKRLPGLFFSIPRYVEEDPLYSSVTHEAFGKMYRKIGYSSM